MSLVLHRLAHLVVVAALLMIREAVANPIANASRVRGDYIRLRNIDPQGDLPVHAASWRAVSERMRQSFDRAKTELSPRDLLFGADTHLRLYRQTRNQTDLFRAMEFVDHLLSLSDSSGGQETGEALILRGDMSLVSGEESSATVRWYQKAALVPSARKVALARLQSLANNTFTNRLPSGDLEVPRLLPRSASKTRPVRKRLVLDPGHGGFDSGAEGVRGLLEKDVVLDIATQVKKILEERSDMAVHLTRTDDSFVPLARRTQYANQKRADAFVSLHLNASPDHRVKGLEAYYLDTTDDEASRLLAQRENGVPQGAEVDDLSYILSDLIQSGKLEDSIELTHALESAVHRTTQKAYRETSTHGVKKGPFFVLVGAHMPCALVELYFVDHPQDGAKLATDDFRFIVSEGIAAGMTRYALGEAPPREEKPRVTRVSTHSRTLSRRKRGV